ncbi:diacylglycerol/lipid kinase family protein [Thiofilum flexile]|uniref:diacylglycerol/lipid kinase family protein n=1 Tax=Thiofilum flexile TaxID=125627 RepID=UPI000380D4BD|nr:diacylglycerol kinase family protein [Thiofilum flexile]
MTEILLAIKKIPVFINLNSGSAKHLLPILKRFREVSIQPITPATLPDLIKAEIAAGEDRVIICGGDGTLALAANHLAGSNTALAVLPGGTLNHFAHYLGIPTDVKQALSIALHSQAMDTVDVGCVNNRLFLNTSSVGTYVRFVRTRDYLERYMGYRSASVLAAIRRLVRLRSSRLFFNAEKVRTPLAFIGLRERELSFPSLGKELEQGAHGLHVIILKVETRWEMIRLMFNIIVRGLDPLQKARKVDSRMLESVEIDNHYRKRSIYVALDGELTLQNTPLKYHYIKNGLKVVIPPEIKPL